MLARRSARPSCRRARFVARLYPELAGRTEEADVEAVRAVIGLPPRRRRPGARNAVSRIPGERIVGITLRGAVARCCMPSTCPALAAFDDQPERWIRPALDRGAPRAHVHNVTIDVDHLEPHGGCWDVSAH